MIIAPRGSFPILRDCHKKKKRGFFFLFWFKTAKFQMCKIRFVCAKKLVLVLRVQCCWYAPIIRHDNGFANETFLSDVNGMDVGLREDEQNTWNKKSDQTEQCNTKPSLYDSTTAPCCSGFLRVNASHPPFLTPPRAHTTRHRPITTTTTTRWHPKQCACCC